MRLTKLFYSFSLLLLFGALSFLSFGQTSLDWSVYNGMGLPNTKNYMDTMGDHIYTVGLTNSTDFNTTDASVLSIQDIYITKYDYKGNRKYAKLIGSSGTNNISQVAFVGDKILVLGKANANDFPTANSIDYKNNDIFIAVIDTSGTVVKARYLGTSSNGDQAISLNYIDNHIYLAGVVQAAGYPVTNGTSFDAITDIVFTKLDLNLNIKFSTYLGGDSRENFSEVKYSNGKLAMVGSTYSTNFPTTNSSSYQGNSDVFCTIFDTAGSILSSSLHGGTGYNNYVNFIFEDTGVYVNSFSTDASSFSNPFTDAFGSPKTTGVLAINLSGDEIFSTAIGNGLGKISQIEYYDDNIYYVGSSSDTTLRRTNIAGNNGGLDYFFTKLDLLGNLVHSFYFGGNSSDYSNNYNNLFFIKDNEVHLHGFTSSTDISTTDGSSYSGNFDNIIYNLDTAGNVKMNRYIGSSVYDQDKAVDKFNEYLHISETRGNDYPVTNNSIYNGNNDLVISKISMQGRILISSFLGGEESESHIKHIMLGNKILLFGSTYSKRFPVTLNESSKIGLSSNKASNFYLAMLNLCPNGYDTTSNALTPAVQNVCKNGFVNQIIGDKMTITGDSLPTIYKNTIATTQQEVDALYQWQTSTNISGPWNNIFGAVLKDFTPNPTVINKYFRRISKLHPCCGDSIIHISSISSILVNSLTAPVADAGGLFNTCPGSPINIGGSPAATGGTAPYSYSWDKIAAPDSSYANPSVSRNTNTVFTLTVVDSNGCVQKDQCLVNVFKANAGTDVWACANDSAKILTVIPQGISGISYLWTPSTGLNSSTLAQPMANPSSTATYYLTQTLPKTGGGTCSTLDTVVVNKVTGPNVANFAGLDDTICNYNTKTFNPNTSGLPPGTTYEWLPKNYLKFPLTANAMHAPNFTSTIVQPNPITYTLTATSGGCHFTDNLSLAVIYASPSFSGCNLSGEQTIYNYDSPNLNESYSWSKLSGSGIILGPTNSNNLFVDVGTGSSTFQIETVLGSTTCTGSASTPGCGCGLILTPLCPTKNGDSIRITARPLVGSANDYFFTWTPTIDLNKYDSSVVYMTGTTTRTYNVAIKSKTDTTFTCGNSITIDPSSFTLPIIVALDDTVCPGEILSLGETNDPGHTYKWSPASRVSDHEVSNPTHVSSNSIDIFVTKTRNSNKCIGRDTSSILVLEVFANAGADKTICNSSTLQLGSSALPNCTYKWTPSNASFQNGTTDSSAQPDVLVAITQMFIVTATDTLTGCTAKDTVVIEVNAIPSIPDFPDTFLCIGQSKRIGSAAKTDVTYSWSPTTGLDNASIALPNCNATTSTSYTLTASFPGGCSAQDNVYVTVRDPSFSLSDINYCPSNGAFAVGSAAPFSMSNYSWSPSNLLTSGTIRNPSTLNPPPSGATQFSLEVTDSYGCKADTFLTIIPTLIEPLAGPNKTLCKNNSVSLGSSSNQTGAGISYTWSPVTGLNSNTSITPVCTPVDTGAFQYILTKVNSNTSCTSRDTVNIIVKQYEINATSPPAMCKNGSQEIGVNNDPGTLYYWSPTAYLSDSTTSKVIASPPQTSTYTLTAIGANGCSDQEDVIVGVRNAIVPTIHANNLDTCIQDSIVTLFATISPVGTYNYYWTPNNGTVVNPNIEDAEIKLISEGSFLYNIEVTDSAGCKVNKDVGLSVQVCTLPVELLYFNVKKQGIGGLLEWSTVTEINNSHFEIEKSYNGKNWENIGQVNSYGDGNNAGISNYNYLDLNLLEGNNMYRLRQVDFNGNFEYSSIKILHHNVLDNKSIVLYPIPSKDNITLEANGENEISKVKILDIQGKEIFIKSKVLSYSKWELVTKDLAKGIYLIQISDNQGKITNTKFILE